MTKYGACHRRKPDDIVWFRTSQKIAAGFYSLKSHPKEVADVYIAESVPALIMHVYPWVHEEESDFQEETAASEMNQDEREHLADKLTEQLVSQLDPNDDKVWVDEPHWLRKLHPVDD